MYEKWNNINFVVESQSIQPRYSTNDTLWKPSLLHMWIKSFYLAVNCVHGLMDSPAKLLFWWNIFLNHIPSHNLLSPFGAFDSLFVCRSVTHPHPLLLPPPISEQAKNHAEEALPEAFTPLSPHDKILYSNIPPSRPFFFNPLLLRYKLGEKGCCPPPPLFRNRVLGWPTIDKPPPACQPALCRPL